MEQVLYTLSEVSDLLKCNINFVYKLINSGELKGLKLGRMKVSKFELERFLKDNTGKDLTDPNNIKLIKEKWKWIIYKYWIKTVN